MSTAPSPVDDYAFPPAPARPILDREVWDAVMAGPDGIGPRLRAIEAKRTELQDLIDDLSFNGQARIDAAITPLIEQVQTDLNGLAEQVAATLAANNQIIADFQAVTAVNLEELEDKIVEVEQRIETILAGGIAAADVAESSTRVFVTPAQRTLIETTSDDLEAFMADVDGGTF